MIDLKDNSNINGQIITVALLFVVNPFVAMLTSLVFALLANKDYQQSDRTLLLFIYSVTIWISLVNITKTISGDQGTYTRLFLSIHEIGFFNMLFESLGYTGGTTSKDPVFSIITWILYWLTGGSVRLYYFILSFGIYLPHFLATHKLFKAMEAPKGAFICGVLVLTFFSQYFVMTLQLIRQMLAAGLVIYALVYRIVEEKNNWWLLASAVLIHTSAIYIAILSLIPWFYSWMNFKRVMTVLAIIVPVIVFNSFVANFIGMGSGISALEYGASRFGQTGLADEASKGASMSFGIMIMVFGPLTIISVAILKRYKKSLSICNDQEEKNEEICKTESENSKILPVVYIFFLLMLFVLSFTKSPLVQYRFFYYSYSFIPLLIPLLFKKEPWESIYWTSASLFFIIRFFVSHNSSGWRYADVFSLCTETLYYYWTGNFHWMYLL